MYPYFSYFDKCTVSFFVFALFAVAIVGSVIALESNAEGSFAVIILRDLKEVIVTVLVTGCLKELLLELSGLNRGKTLGDRNKENSGGRSDDPLSLGNHNSVSGQVDADLGDIGADIIYHRGSRQSCTSRGNLERVDRESGDGRDDDDDDDMVYSFPPQTRTSTTSGRQAVVAVIFGAHMLLETSPLASLDGEHVLPYCCFLILVEWRAARRIELFALRLEVTHAITCNLLRRFVRLPLPLSSALLYFTLLCSSPLFSVTSGATSFLMVADAKDVTLHSPEVSPAPNPTPTPTSTPVSTISQAPSRGANAGSGTKNIDRSRRHPSEPSIRIAALIHYYFPTEIPTILPSTSRLGRTAAPTLMPPRVISYSVRGLLLSEGRQHGWRSGTIIPCVLGMVIYKGLLVDDLDPDPVASAIPCPDQPESYKTFCDKQAEYYRQSHQSHNPVRVKKCRVVLRDEKYDDIITLYMPVSMATTCVVGLCVAVWGSAVHLASSMRSLYLKAVDRTEIGRCVK